MDSVRARVLGWGRGVRLALAVALAAASLVVVAAGPAEAAPGDLDPTFNGGTALGPAGEGAAVARQPDGTLVVGGSSADVAANPDWRLARFHADGTPDTTFGVNGVVTTDRSLDSLADVALQPDGKIVAVGATGTSQAALVFTVGRYTAGGLPDPTFGVGGFVTTSMRGRSAANAVAVQADGAIVVAGRAEGGGTQAFMVARYTATGLLDESFDGDGVALTDLAGGNATGAYGLALVDGGKIVASGCSGFGASNQCGMATLVRYTPTGALDPGFGTGGVVVAPAEALYHRGGKLAVQESADPAQRKLVVAGHNSRGQTVTRFWPDGTLDTGFGGGDGFVEGPTDGGSTTGVVVQSDGAVVVGDRVTRGRDTLFRVVRYTPAGDLDGAFGAGGIATTDFGPGQAEVGDLILQPDGRLVAAGYAGRFSSAGARFALARYETAPSTSQVADVSVSGADSPDPVVSGTTLTYTLGVANDGPDSAYRVTASAVLPAGSGFLSASASQGACAEASGTVTCSLNGLVSGGSATLTIVVHAGPAGAEALTFSATTSSDDPAPANNALALATTVAPAAGAMTALPALTAPRAGASAVLGDGRVLVVSAGSAVVYDPAAGTTAATGAPVATRYNHTATTLADGRVLVAGGSPGGGGALLATAELYDPATNTWSATTTPMAAAHSRHTALLLANDKVLVVGGNDLAAGATCPGPGGVPNSAELFDPKANNGAGAWSTTANLVVPRVYHTTTRLDGGRVLAVGGYIPGMFQTACGISAAQQNAPAELYDPAANDGAGAWTTVADTSIRRNRHAATLLPDGSVLVSGGNVNNCSGCPTTSVERFSPATGTWSARAPLPLARSLHTTTTLANGTVLVAGGVGVLQDNKVTYPRPVSLYDPGTDTWAPAGITTEARVSPAVALAHNRVLLVGGYNGSTPLASVELWTPRPVLSSLSPTSIAHGATLTLTGTGLATVSSVSFGGVSTTAVTHDATSPDTVLRVVVPRDAPNARVDVTATSPGGPSATSPATLVTVLGGTFTPLPPARILDTRSAAESGNPANPIGVCTNPSTCGPIGPGQTLTLTVAGQGGVPLGGAAAVVVNVTVVSPSAAGYMTVYPSGEAQPTASNLNYSAAQTVPNLVTVKVGADGKVKLFNASGTTHAIVDVAGWYDDGTTAPASRYNALTPARVLDTRSAAESGNPSNPIGVCTNPSTCAAIGPAGTLTLTVAGQGGVPPTGATAVVLNVTAVNPSAGSYLTVWPSTDPRPNASNLNFVAGQTVPNLVAVKLGTDGKVKIFNAAGTTHVIADVAGWYGAAGATAGSRLTAVTPARILDTRSAAASGNPSNPVGVCASPCAAIGPAGTLTLTVAAQGGVPPTGATAVVVNVTAVSPTGSGYLTVWPSTDTQPNASNLNFTAGQTVPNLVAVKLGTDGRVKVFNSAGTTHVIADVAGWFNDGT